MTKPGYRQSAEHIAARFAGRGIIPQTQADWKQVAETLAAEVERLRSQVEPRDNPRLNRSSQEASAAKAA